MITILMILFFMYQIYVSRLELRSRDSPFNIKDYAVKVSHLPKDAPNELKREIQTNFAQFGRISEIVPVRNYSKALELELKIGKISERIGDIKAKDQIKNTNSQKRIDDLITKEQKLSQKAQAEVEKAKTGKNTNEWIVVFETTKSRRECIERYRGYSHWWSRPHKNMPDNLRLAGKYGFKVKDAPEPGEYTLENWYRSRILQLVVIAIVFSISLVGCVLLLDFTLPEMNKNWLKIPNYTQCNKYYFENVDASTYLNAVVAVDQDEISCF
jgi:hypothetical protein